MPATIHWNRNCKSLGKSRKVPKTPANGGKSTLTCLPGKHPTYVPVPGLKVSSSAHHMSITAQCSASEVWNNVSQLTILRELREENANNGTTERSTPTAVQRYKTRKSMTESSAIDGGNNHQPNSGKRVHWQNVIVWWLGMSWASSRLSCSQAGIGQGLPLCINDITTRPWKD